MGEVFLAAQPIAGGVRPVIIKTLLPDLAAQQDFVAQFLDEARVVATLNHPNVVTLLEVGTFEGQPVIVMEFVRGSTVSQLRRVAGQQGRSISPTIAATIARDAAAGLAHAHHATDHAGAPLGIVHRDVSPQNLMVRSDGVTKVLDFGIATAANRGAARTQTGVIKGKLAYMAPEQLLGQPVTHHVDQFALGVVLWELLAGRRLFDASAEQALVEQVLEAPIVAPSRFNPQVSEALDRITLTALARSPQDRFPDCEALVKHLSAELPAGSPDSVAELVRAVSGDEQVFSLETPFESPELSFPSSRSDQTLTVPARPPPTPTPAPRTTPKRWRALGLMAVIAVVAGAGALVARRAARGEAETRVRSMLDENAGLAGQSLERFCAKSQALSQQWPALPETAHLDAAPVLAPLVSWSTDSAVVQQGQLALEAVAVADAGAWYEQLALHGSSEDLSFFAALHQYDTWSLFGAGPLATTPSAFSSNELPMPDFAVLRRAARLHLARSMSKGDVQTAFDDVRHLATLMRSTDTLLGEMMASMIAVDAHDVIEATRHRGLTISAPWVLSAEQRLEVRQLSFASASFFWPGVEEKTMTRAASCSIAPCTALNEGAFMHAIAGKLAGTDTAGTLKRLLTAQRRCDSRLLDFNLAALQLDSATLLTRSAPQRAWIRRLYDEQ